MAAAAPINGPARHLVAVSEAAATPSPAARAPAAAAQWNRQEDATSRRWSLLMTAAQGGDGVSYRRLLTEIDGWLNRYYARRLPIAMAPDAAQDALLAIHNRRHTYQPGRPFMVWLAAIARYKWIDRLRAMSRAPTTTSLEDDQVEGAVPDHGAAVASAVLLGDLLKRLKPAQSHVIQLVKLQGFSIEEASERTGQSASLVKINIHRGLARLGTMIEREAV